MTPQETENLLVYRDAMMLVINKPAGIPVHKGFGGGENLEESFKHLTFGLPRAPALAHRLDKDTSGCLILGRHAQALKTLSQMFASNQIKKTYWAIVKGAPLQAEGRIDIPLVKKEEGRHRWHMKAAEGNSAGAQSAVTDYKVIAQLGGGLTFLELKPQTGRTHQLRVHCAELGCAVLGDKIYGGGEAPLFLHARQVEVPLYPKKPPIMVEAEPPEYMNGLINEANFNVKIL
jgi:RluA family pseudouridine synthase